MSSVDAIRAKITSLKLSPAGERWVTQALYPPGDLTRVAIPTRTHYPTLRIEYRPSAVVAAPAGVAGNWDLLVFSPPTDSTMLVWVAGPAGTNFESTTSPANTAFGFLTSVPNIAPVASTVQVFTRNSSGTGTYADFQTVQNPVKHLGFRITSKSYTCHMTASDLYNSGTVTTAQYDTRYTPEAGFSFVANRPVIGCYGTAPLVEDEITASSPYAVVGEAKDGVFVPHRIMGPAFDFVRTMPARNRCGVSNSGETFTISTSATGATGLGVAPFFSTATGLNSLSQPWWAAGVWGTAARPDDTGFDAVTTGVSIFRGLNNQATITLVGHVGLENILQVESPFRTLAGDPDEPDTRALSSYFEIAARMPHAYPASYNALGLVLPAIASALRFITPHLPKIWEGVKTVAPYVAPILGDLLKKEESKPERKVKRVERRLVRDVARITAPRPASAGPALPTSRPRRRGSSHPVTKQLIFARRRRVKKSW